MYRREMTIPSFFAEFRALPRERIRSNPWPNCLEMQMKFHFSHLSEFSKIDFYYNLQNCRSHNFPWPNCLNMKFNLSHL